MLLLGLKAISFWAGPHGTRQFSLQPNEQGTFRGIKRGIKRKRKPMGCGEICLVPWAPSQQLIALRPSNSVCACRPNGLRHQDKSQRLVNFFLKVRRCPLLFPGFLSQRHYPPWCPKSATARFGCKQRKAGNDIGATLGGAAQHATAGRRSARSEQSSCACPHVRLGLTPRPSPSRGEGRPREQVIVSMILRVI